MGRAEDLFNRIVEQGKAAIDEFIATRQSEELFLDFKRSADNGGGRNLNNKDRSNLSKAISGFGNSEGGVIVWGIDCSLDDDGADVARAHKPITNVRRFVSWLEGAVSGCTIPPHGGVRNHPVEINEAGDGFVVTLIPTSQHAPHQAVPELKYYMRAGSDFKPVPHAILAGMFGRRPQPNVYITYAVSTAQLEGNAIRFGVGFRLYNEGIGVARDPFLNINIWKGGGNNSKISFEKINNNWLGEFSLGISLHLLGKPEVRLAPKASICPVIMNFRLEPPFKSIWIEGNCGCSESPPYQINLGCTAQELADVYESFIEGVRSGDVPPEGAHGYTDKILKDKNKPNEITEGR